MQIDWQFFDVISTCCSLPHHKQVKLDCLCTWDLTSLNTPASKGVSTTDTLIADCAEGNTDPRSVSAVTGNSKELMVQAMLSPHCQAVRPSLLAAAVLVLDRQSRGINPIWPAALSQWTGISGPGSPDFEGAISAVLPVLVKY